MKEIVDDFVFERFKVIRMKKNRKSKKVPEYITISSTNGIQASGAGKAYLFAVDITAKLAALTGEGQDINVRKFVEHYRFFTTDDGNYFCVKPCIVVMPNANTLSSGGVTFTDNLNDQVASLATGTFGIDPLPLFYPPRFTLLTKSDFSQDVRKYECPMKRFNITNYARKAAIRNESSESAPPNVYLVFVVEVSTSSNISYNCIEEIEFDLKQRAIRL